MLIKRIIGVFDDPYPPNIGNIKIGTKGEKVTSNRGTEYRPPVKLGHFMVTTLEVRNGTYVPDEQAIADYGAEPKEIPIVFPFPKIDDCLVTSYSYFAKQRRVCYGNGQVAFRYQEATNEYKQIPCDPEQCPFFQQGQCKPYGLLKTYLRTGEDYRQVRTGGLFVFRTTSWTTLFSLYNTLYDIVRILGSDNLLGIPLWLRYTHYTIKGPELRTVPNIVFEYRPDYEEVAQRRTLMATEDYRALPSWMTDDIVEPDDVLSDVDGEVVEPAAPAPKAETAKATDAAKVFNELNNGSLDNTLFGDVPEYVYKGKGNGDSKSLKPEDVVAKEAAPKKEPAPKKEAASKKETKTRRRASSRRAVVNTPEDQEESPF